MSTSSSASDEQAQDEAESRRQAEENARIDEQQRAEEEARRDEQQKADENDENHEHKSHRGKCKTRHQLGGKCTTGNEQRKKLRQFRWRADDNAHKAHLKDGSLLASPCRA